ncbi:MAG: chemotaxis protein CheB, partial [Candidatus Acidiferrales bacterium]
MKNPKGNAHRKAAPAKSNGAARPTAAEPSTFPVVGIGASAGGLEAFTELLRDLPEKTGMAFVLVQHLDPTHDSVLQEILARATRIPVREVKDNEVILRDHVYVIPANANMIIEDGALHLVPRESARSRNMPIDH